MALGATPAMGAGFTLNFDHSGSQLPGGDIALGRTTGPSGGNDGTRFIQDQVNIGGVDYFHVVVIDDSSDFRQESYTAAVVQNACGSCRGGARSYSPYSGGNERSVIGDRTTTSFNQDSIIAWTRARVGNAKDPFGTRKYSGPGDTTGTLMPQNERYRISGNGSMDPSRVVLLMQLSDATVSMEVYKPQLNRKPRVSQTLVEGGLTARFIADMRGLLYSDLSRAAPLTNTMTLADPGLPTPGAADFDMSFAQKPRVNAGRFTYTPGTGWVDATTNAPVAGWDVDNSRFLPGTYTYSDGNFDVLNVDWTSFFDPAQNPGAKFSVN